MQTSASATEGQRQLISRVEASIEPVIAAMGFALVRVKLTGGRKKTLQIMAERSDGSIDVSDCAEISLAVSAALDVEDPFRGEYVLEVSSPGIDRPLVKLNDFERYVGHLAKIKLEAPIGGRKRFSGKLLGVRDRTIKLVMEEAAEANKRVELPYDNIEEAQLILTDELIQESLNNTKDDRRDS
jgi:ribosome maturation factor RimP